MMTEVPNDAKTWWQTVCPDRRVLIMAPTVTSVKRLLDIAGLFHGDLRIGLSFTVPPNELGRGTESMLAGLGVPLVPWRQAASRRYDLAVTANLGGIAEVDAPVALFSHGASRNSLATPRGRGSIPVPAQVHGFSRSALIQRGMLVPSAVLLGHDLELALLAQDCPEALPVASVVGDPCFDRLVAGRRLRGRYRAALGLRPGQKLVVATSTWRGNSLFASAPHVIERLAELLDSPEYRVVLMLHPNIYAAHSEYQVRAWWAHALRRGLILARAEEDWQPFLLAADYIVGDHGSVTLYGATSRVPVLLGAYPDADVHPQSGAAALGAVAPRLVDSIAMRDQLTHAAEQFDPLAMAGVASLISSEPGAFARHTRRRLYGMLGLGQPATPAGLLDAPAPPSLRAMAAHAMPGGYAPARRPRQKREAVR
ncbi:MAG TPA: hypothetical protein VH372_06275 [Actinospica sp.]|nr:hypothetical protein [Actinospica sp.]